MKLWEIAAHLRELLILIRNMVGAVEDGCDEFLVPDQQKAARALIALHERLAAACKASPLHYKTRIKLLRVVDQATGLVALCYLLEQATLPAYFDPKRLRVEIVTMCHSVSEALEPVVDYYSREQWHAYEEFSRDLVPMIAKFSETNVNFSAGLSTHIKGGNDARDDTTFRKFSKIYPSPSKETFYKPDVFGPLAGWIKNPEEFATNSSIEKSAKHALAMNLGNHAQNVKIGPTEVPVYFGTTRSPSGNSKDKPAARFLNGRGSGELILGRAVISIPPGHRIGKLEQPLSIWKLRLKPNPEKHIVLRSVETMEVEDWVFAVHREWTVLPQRTAFVFIHGFNVTFSDAMMRAGQIARDIEYEGLVTAFSWGSEGTIGGYQADADTVELAVPQLVEFLKMCSTDAGVEAFHIVAHSMGCRALLSALKNSNWWSTLKTPVAEAVFAAPDVDATQYQRSMMTMLNNAGRYTLYGSERDWAIAVSRSIRKNHPRAGDGGKNILVMNGVETVDATKVGEQLFGLGHSYIADKRSILGDLWAVLHGLPMPRFGLKERKNQVGKYWALVP